MHIYLQQNEVSQDSHHNIIKLRQTLHEKYLSTKTSMKEKQISYTEVCLFLLRVPGCWLYSKKWAMPDPKTPPKRWTLQLWLQVLLSQGLTKQKPSLASFSTSVNSFDFCKSIRRISRASHLCFRIIWSQASCSQFYYLSKLGDGVSWWLSRLSQFVLTWSSAGNQQFCIFN